MYKKLLCCKFPHCGVNKGLPFFLPRAHQSTLKSIKVLVLGATAAVHEECSGPGWGGWEERRLTPCILHTGSCGTDTNRCHPSSVAGRHWWPITEQVLSKWFDCTLHCRCWRNDEANSENHTSTPGPRSDPSCVPHYETDFLLLTRCSRKIEEWENFTALKLNMAAVALCVNF